MYAVCSQVPVRLTYKNGTCAVRYLWRFRAPIGADLDAVRAAEEELAANEARWANLIPTEPITPESNYNRGHRLYGVNYWREFFLPRQLLTVIAVMDEVQKVAAKIRSSCHPKRPRLWRSTCRSSSARWSTTTV